jgi:hypothetical protein
VDEKAAVRIKAVFDKTSQRQICEPQQEKNAAIFMGIITAAPIMKNAG